MAAHPLRRATDDRPDGPDFPASTLVVLMRHRGATLSWLARDTPDCIDEVIVVGGPLDVRVRTELLRRRPGLRLLEAAGGDDGAGRPLQGIGSAAGRRIVLMDAHGSMSPREIPRYLHYLDSGFDFVKGSRFIAGGDCSGYPVLRRLGHRALLAVAFLLYGQRLTDLWYGFCAFRREFLDLLAERLTDIELVGAETVVHALHFGLRVAEVPSTERSRTARRTGRHTVRDGRRLLCLLWRERPRNILLRRLARLLARRRAQAS
ncbi:glycosyltransferase [Streptomyces sp. NPDC086023]|uniref:glycosyltransferase n=1 Tax=Streptomyces sp. NPDC086023 TaxID=3365746 RepID=UPI0037D862C4